MVLGAEWTLREGLPSVVAAALQAGSCIPVFSSCPASLHSGSTEMPTCGLPTLYIVPGPHIHPWTLPRSYDVQRPPTFSPPLLFPSCLTWSLTLGKGKLRRKGNRQVHFDLEGWWHL